MAGCKRYALKRRKGKGKKKRKEKEKGGKNWGSKSFLYKCTRIFFHMRSGHFLIYKENCLELVNHIRYCLR